MHESNLAVLTRDIEARGLERGDIGTVAHRYASGSAFAFATGQGRTVAVLTLEPSALRLMEAREIL